MLNEGGPLRSAVAPWVSVRNLGCFRLRHALLKLLQTVRRIRPRVIVSTFGYMNLAVLGLRPFLDSRTRILVREANMPSRSLRAMIWPRLVAVGYRWFYPRADRVLCPTRAIKRELIDTYGVTADRAFCLPNPVDVETIRAAARYPKRKFGSGRRFVSAGRLTEQKGFDRLLGMLASTPPESHLTIFGEGPQRPALEAQVARLGLGARVRLAGFESKPWAAYAGADAFVLPSRWEGMPNVALEALACGTPVIATPEAGGAAEVAEEAPAGAVTIAETGEPFVRAMLAVAPKPSTVPRASLLPERFQSWRVQEAFAAILKNLTEDAPPPARTR